MDCDRGSDLRQSMSKQLKPQSRRCIENSSKITSDMWVDYVTVLLLMFLVSCQSRKKIRPWRKLVLTLLGTIHFIAPTTAGS